MELSSTQTQWRAIAYLSRMEGCRQNELAEVIEVRPITVCRLLDRLAALDLIERRADPGDRRASRLFLTAKGAREGRTVARDCRRHQQARVDGRLSR